jgi:hypothetical protein
MNPVRPTPDQPQYSVISNRLYGWTRKFLKVSALVLLLMAVLRHSVQDWLLPASSSLGTTVFLGFAATINFLAGAIFLVFSAIRARTPGWSVIRTSVSVVAVLLLLLNLASLGETMWRSYTAPQAEFIIPDDFSGHVEIVVKYPLPPSLQTARKVSRYVVPANGISINETGWLGYPMYSGGELFNRPGRDYGFYFRRADGRPLRPDEFTFHLVDPQHKPMWDSMIIEIRKPQPATVAGNVSSLVSIEQRSESHP